MKKFYLSKCIHGSNKEINMVWCKTRQQAIDYFNNYSHIFHEIVKLDNDGYQKLSDGTTYIVAEAHN